MTYEALSEPFDKRFIDTVKKGARSEDYVNHAVVTDRLNRAAPGWAFEVLHIETYSDEVGKPHVAGVLVGLTVDGVTRQEGGDAGRQANFGDELKNAVSDGLKRAAMRFGVAIQLWHQLPELAPSTSGASHSAAPEKSTPHESAGVTSSAEEMSSGQTTAASGSTADREGGSGGLRGEATPEPSTCTHIWSPFKPDGSTPLPKNYHRCERCGLVEKETV